MSINKERIENLEASFEDLQTNFNRMEEVVSDNLRQIEAAINRMSHNCQMSKLMINLRECDRCLPLNWQSLSSQSILEMT